MGRKYGLSQLIRPIVNFAPALLHVRASKIQAIFKKISQRNQTQD